MSLPLMDDLHVPLQEAKCGSGSVSGDGKPSKNGLRMRFKNIQYTGEFSGDCKTNNNAADASVKGNPVITSKTSTCSLCGKTFPSLKSLFGHMRCHPDRPWRGIEPPPLDPKNSPSSTIPDAVARKIDNQIDSASTTMTIDLSEHLRGWSVTARRGRKSTASAVQEEQKLRTAVHELLSLVHGDSFTNPAVSPSKQRIEGSDATNTNNFLSSNNARIEDMSPVIECAEKRRVKTSAAGNEYFPYKKLRIDERGPSNWRNESMTVLKKTERGQGKDLFKSSGFDPESVNKDYRWDGTDESEEDSKNNCKEESNNKNVTGNNILEKQPNHNYEITKKKAKKTKFRELKTLGDFSPLDYKKTLATSYKCTTCNKSFPSYQALGGHRASHNKVKNNFAVAVVEESALAADASAEKVLDGVAVNIPAQTVESLEFGEAAGSKFTNTHQCKICNKTFLTGQALGGHKRCHWTAPLEALHTQLTPLGELPVMEINVEAQSHQAICHTASSSHNSDT